MLHTRAAEQRSHTYRITVVCVCVRVRVWVGVLSSGKRSHPSVANIQRSKGLSLNE